jgi:hypothetical protein
VKLNQKDSKKQHELIHKDAQSWLEQARLLMIASKAVYGEFEKATLKMRSLPQTQMEMLAFSQAYMLLTGFAFENLFKGILIGQDPTYKLDQSDGGHGIVEMAKEIDPQTTSAECALLKRVHRYLKWAGRYQLPKSADDYYQSQNKVSISTSDFAVIEHLFNRFEGILQYEWRSRQSNSGVV